MEYLGDIMVYNESLEEHKHHLELVFEKLRENNIYLKREKYAFTQKRIQFLGHIIEEGRVRMDPKKIHAVVNWPNPSNILELQSFLGLANYYRRFVSRYSKLCNPLTELLKKGKQWDWSKECEASFREVK